ncbi:hypothetical protein AFLA_011307 [Aspergillus flavus NRRL3357]|nr:hypothetical protein AFLA_011307 [Aspergillus flavus NRRL3357]
MIWVFYTFLSDDCLVLAVFFWLVTRIGLKAFKQSKFWGGIISNDNKTTYYYTSSPEAQACVLKISNPTTYLEEIVRGRHTSVSYIDTLSTIMKPVSLTCPRLHLNTTTWCAQPVLRRLVLPLCLTRLTFTCIAAGCLKAISFLPSTSDSVTFSRLLFRFSMLLGLTTLHPIIDYSCKPKRRAITIDLQFVLRNEASIMPRFQTLPCCRAPPTPPSPLSIIVPTLVLPSLPEWVTV